MEIKKLFVVGAGVMGAGLGQLAAQVKMEAYVMDTTDEIVQKAAKKIRDGLAKRVEQAKMTQADMDDVLSRIHWTSSLDAAKECDFVIEAIYENLEAKQTLLKKLDALCRPDVIFASNTTALSVSAIAQGCNRPDKVIGMHFFNPPVVMKLVEIIRGEKTSEETIAATKKLAEVLGKTPIVTKKEAPGGIVSRVLAGMLNEAVRVYADGIASAEDIDNAMKLGAGVPMGPLALVDMIGLDIHVAKMKTLHAKLKDDTYKPHPILEQMVSEGKLGKKKGQGFYTY
jgi:3-hydroxybutyryl-CoA dehydrogenase